MIVRTFIRTAWSGCGVLFVAFALALTVPAAAQNATPPEVAQALAVFDAECAKIQSLHEETVAGSPRVYTNQLMVIRRKLQDAGDLEGVLAVMQESERFIAAIKGEADPFELVPEMPESALVKTPATLRQLQDSYLKNKSDQAELRNKQFTDLAGRLIGRLDVITRDLTIRNRIAEAVLVKKEGDYWRKMIADSQMFGVIEGRMLERSGRMPPTKVDPPATPSGGRTESSAEAPWRTWKLAKIAGYAQEGSLFDHPDLPDELSFTFDKENGQIRVDGIRVVAQTSIDMRDRAWLGKAIRWSVPSAKQLDATFQITSKALAPNKDGGPAVQLIVQYDKTSPQVFTWPILYRDMTLQIVHDAATDSRRIVWVQSRLPGTLITVPADALNIRVLLTLTTRRPGERCDSTITVR
jgi:hypothetical protein